MDIRKTISTAAALSTTGLLKALETADKRSVAAQKLDKLGDQDGTKGMLANLAAGVLRAEGWDDAIAHAANARTGAGKLAVVIGEVAANIVGSHFPGAKVALANLADIFGVAENRTQEAQDPAAQPSAADSAAAAASESTVEPADAPAAGPVARTADAAA